MTSCSQCGNPLAPDARACAQCGRLVYATEAETFSRRAGELEAKGEVAASAEVWARVLDFLPRGSSRAADVHAKIDSLHAAVAATPPKTDWKKRLGPLGIVVAFLLKFKTFVFLALTKAKFLFLGLAKLPTILSMFATLGLYWSMYGWKFALGFVVGIYIHEMGHVWMLKHYGLRASAPMFIPGFGAFVSMYDSPASVAHDARIGLAGPLWGAGAALLALIPAALTGQGVWLAVAHATAYINVFNLTPIWTLDGGRAFRALDRKQRILATVAIGICWLVTGDGVLIILALGALYRTFFQKDDAPEADQAVLFQYTGLLVMFAAMLLLIG